MDNQEYVDQIEERFPGQISLIDSGQIKRPQILLPSSPLGDQFQSGSPLNGRDCQIMDKIKGTWIEKLRGSWCCTRCKKEIEPIVIIEGEDEILVCGDCFWDNVIERGEQIGTVKEDRSIETHLATTVGIPEDDYMSDEDRTLWEGYCC
jgi:hypothetical protein